MEDIHDKKYNTKENRENLETIKKAFDWEYPNNVRIPLSWSEDVLNMLNRMKVSIQDMHFMSISENNFGMDFKYSVSRTPKSFADNFVEECIKSLVKKGLHKRKGTKVCPHCGKEI